jgi:hypothetical protein
MLGFVLIVKNPEDSTLDSAGLLTPTETLSVFSGIYQAGIAGNSPGIVNRFKDEQHIVELAGLMLIEESEEYFTGRLTPEPRQRDGGRTEDAPEAGEERRRDRGSPEPSETPGEGGASSGGGGSEQPTTDRSGNFNYVGQMRTNPGISRNGLNEETIQRTNAVLDQQRLALNAQLPPDRQISQEEWARAHTITSAARTIEQNEKAQGAPDSAHLEGRAIDINVSRAAALARSRGLTTVTGETLISDILSRTQENQVRAYATRHPNVFHIDTARNKPPGIIRNVGIPLPPVRIGQ